MEQPADPPTLKPAPRPLCGRCQRPLRTCLCAWIRPTPNQVPVLVLQHPEEAGHAKGSARLLALSLAACHCVQGLAWEAAALPKGLLGGAVLLYPGAKEPGDTPAAPEVTLEVTPKVRPTANQQPTCLVVLDGTWRQSRQLLRFNPWLQALPRVALLDPPPSLYRIRKAQQGHQRSTLEATCLALGALEGRPEHYQPLLQGFAQWVLAAGVAAFTA